MQEEEMLDEQSRENTEEAVDMAELAEAWAESKAAKPQRTPPKSHFRKTNPTGTINKRSRETSPSEKKKPTKDNNSPPLKRGVVTGYSSSDDENERNQHQRPQEEKGQPIPTIVSSSSGAKGAKEQIPNPFRREHIDEWGEHPLRSKSS